VENDIRELKFSGPWRGIWQGPNPPPGSFRDMCNLQISGDYITRRPGIQQITGVGTTGSVLCAFKFGSTINYPYHGTDSSRDILSGTPHYVFLNNGSTYRGYAFSGTEPSSAAVQISFLHDDYDGTSERINHVNALWKTTTTNSSVLYLPCEVLCNGKSCPSIYIPSGSRTTFGDDRPVVRLLDSIDAGDSSVSYLTDPPICKYVAKFKERIFMAGGDEHPRTVFFSAPDSSGVFIANAWPSSYNFDVGGGDRITGLVATQDVLYVFKENSIYVISGDGVGGNWSVDCLSDSVGAIFGDTCIGTPEGVFFVSPGGLCVIKDGNIANISSLALVDIWKRVSTKSDKWWTVYDPIKRRVLFFGNVLTGTASSYSNQIFVYDIDNVAIYRWGATLVDELDRNSTSPVSTTAFTQVYFAEFLDGYIGKGCVVLRTGSITPGAGIQIGVFLDGNEYDTQSTLIATADNPILWRLETNNLPAQNNKIVLLRNVIVNAVKTGDWDILIRPVLDGKTDTALAGKFGKFANITTATSSATQNLDRTCPFAAGDKVDVFQSFDCYKFADSLTVASLSGLAASEIKFTTSIDTSAFPGRYFVVAEDSFPRMTKTMYDNANEVLGNAACVWAYTTGGNANSAVFTFASEGEQRLSFSNSGLLCKDFRIVITNIGTYLYSSGTDRYYAKSCSRLKLSGLTIGYREMGVSR
jgi:hypothetical protein